MVNIEELTLEELEAQIAAAEALLVKQREDKALARIAHRKKYGAEPGKPLPNYYVGNDDVDYCGGPYKVYEDDAGNASALYIGQRVRILGNINASSSGPVGAYGGVAEIVQMFESGLYNKKTGEPIYKVEVTFSNTDYSVGGKRRHEFWASHCVALRVADVWVGKSAGAKADSTPACDVDPADADALKAALADIDRQLAELNK